MTISTDWVPSQQNLIRFVLVDSSGNEVDGLGTGFTLTLCKADESSFSASAGTKAEIADGWYSYLSAAAEADTYGPVAIKVTGTGVVQQNLEYVVGERNVNAIAFTYTLTDDDTSDPIQGAEVWFTPDSAGQIVTWAGMTDVNGVARDAAGNLPRLDAGTYYVWRQKPGYIFDDPDTETVSA